MLLRIVVRPLCQISYWSRHRPVTIDILCSVGIVACARIRCACLPLFGLSITLNLPSGKAVGERYGDVLKLGVRTSNVSVLLSVLCLVIALSDCITIVSSYSDGELLLTRIHMFFSFLHLFMAEHPSFKFKKEAIIRCPEMKGGRAGTLARLKTD